MSHSYKGKDFDQLCRWGRKVKDPKGPIAALCNEIMALPYGDRFGAGDPINLGNGDGKAVVSNRPENKLRSAGVTTGAMEVTWDPKFHTGCWSWDEESDRHEITVGGEFSLALRANLSRKQMLAAYRSLLRHETWHGIATLEPSKVIAELRRRGLPFPMHNQLEDIRIEHLARNESSALDPRGRFNWATYIKMPRTFDVPANYLNALATAELSINWRESLAKATLDKWNKRMLEWCNYNWTGDEYTTVKSEDNIRLMFQANGKGAGSGHKVTATICGEGPDGGKGGYEDAGEVDLSTWISLADSDPSNANIDMVDSDDASVTDVGSDPTAGNINPATGMPYPSAAVKDHPKDNQMTPAELAGLKWFSTEKHPLQPDWSRVRRIVRTMRGAIANADTTNDDVGSSGRRLHLPGVIARDGDNFTRTRSESDGVITITVVIDMSGSMSHTWRREGGIEFVLALYQLHRAKHIDVRCWLTRTGRIAKLPLDRMSVGKLCEVRPQSGAEGYKAALDSDYISRDMAESKVVIAWSDGALRGGEVSAPELRRRGVDIIGCAPSQNPANNGKKFADLKKHFGRGYVGPVEQLAKRIVNYILKGR